MISLLNAAASAVAYDADGRKPTAYMMFRDMYIFKFDDYMDDFVAISASNGKPVPFNPWESLSTAKQFHSAMNKTFKRLEYK